MSKHTSSSSSSSSETEEIITDAPGGSEISQNKRKSTPRHRQESSTASQISQRSAVATETQYDTASIATSTNTGFTNVSANTSTSQQQVVGGSIPVIPPPVLSQQQLLRTGNPVTNQQYQQHTVQSETTSYSVPNAASGGVYLQQQQQQQQQPRFDVAKAIFTQVDTNRDGAISREEFQQWAQGGNQTGGQFQYQQAQFTNQIPRQQPFNPLLGPNAFKDVILNLDYSAIEAYNIGIQSASDITAEQSPGRFDAAKAIFRQADTNQDGAISREEFRQWAQGGSQNFRGQPSGRFDAAKAIFQQVDANRDGAISRDEFRQWAQGAPQNFGGQSYSNYGNQFNNAQSYPGVNSQLGNILQQSGLGQAYTNY